MLSLLETTRRLRFTRPGRLLPWLGPALRGLLARRFKRRVSHHTPAEQDGPWRYCDHPAERPRRTCPHIAACPYGLTLEPAPPPDAPVFRGQEAAARPVVLAPLFPMPARARPGDEFDLTVASVGPAAREHVGALWDALAEAGADPDGGLGDDRVTFELVPGSGHHREEPIRLPAAPVPGEVAVPRVGVELPAPLFLGSRDE